MSSIKKNKKAFVVAIDGPAGSGKGTVAKLISEKLGFHYLDSGAVYRLIAYAALINNIPPEDEINLNTKHQEFIDWKWVDADMLPNVIVEFKKKLYQDLLKEIKLVIG